MNAAIYGVIATQQEKKSWKPVVGTMRIYSGIYGGGQPLGVPFRVYYDDINQGILESYSVSPHSSVDFYLYNDAQQILGVTIYRELYNGSPVFIVEISNVDYPGQNEYFDGAIEVFM